MQNKVNYVRIILTDQCNLSCAYCHHEGMHVVTEKSVQRDELMMVLKYLYKEGIRKFKLMGGEPTSRKDLPDIIRALSRIGDDNDISIITNGIFDQALMEECFDAGLQRVNVSVHAWNDKKAMSMVGMTPEKQKILKDNLTYLCNEGKLSKINYVYLKNESTDDLFSLIHWTDANLCVIDILNVLSEEADGGFNDEYASFEEIEKLVRENYDVQREYINENIYSLPSKRLVLPGGGEINLKINALNRNAPFNSCTDCKVKERCTEGIKAIRLTKEGHIQPCLFRHDNALSFNEIKESDRNDVIKQYISAL